MDRDPRPFVSFASMATPWDRAASDYVDEWVPRFVPYHLDLVHALALQAGQRVLVTCCGPGSEVLAAARAVGEAGRVRATDRNEEMVRLCREQVSHAGFSNVELAAADATDASGGPWDAVVCAFGLWQQPDRARLVQAWSRSLTSNGKVGVLTWGPSDREGPFEQLAACVRALEPESHVPVPHVEAEREPMARMFETGGLAMVRHTVVRHTLSFRSAEHFVRAVGHACTWRRLWDEIGDQRVARVAAAFYERVGGPDAPLSFESPATLAVAGMPGSEIALEDRPSIRVPKL
jgi:ubiquinone/menaquinone biosynthesis C-methylase UbiE